jgi:hypothetical protein
VGSIIFEWSGSGVRRQSFGHGGTSSPPLEHERRPRSTNYRYSDEQKH